MNTMASEQPSAGNSSSSSSSSPADLERVRVAPSNADGQTSACKSKLREQSEAAAPAASTTTVPHSSSSGGSRRAPIDQPPAGKYREKRRPEPLDLSVKSAGILPAGSQPFHFRQSAEQQQALSAPHHSGDSTRFQLAGLSSLFNCSTNSAGTLETPRFIWHDTTEALIKPRLFSNSSMAIGQTGNRGIFGSGGHLSSLAGDSPPITPGTPNSAYLLERLLSPSSSRILQHPHAAGSPVSIQAAAAAIMQQHQQQSVKTSSRFPLDSVMALSPHFAATNRYFMHQQSSVGKAPRRSSSSDNLHIMAKQHSHESKKNAISPLATKNFSVSPSFNCTSSQTNSRNRFTYLTSPALDGAEADASRESKSPIINVTCESQSSTDVQRSSSSANLGALSSVAPITPTSLSSTTAHLLSIQLDSPQPRAFSLTGEDPATMSGRQPLLTLGDLFMPNSCSVNMSAKRAGQHEQTATSGQPVVQRLLSAPNAAYLSIGAHSASLNSSGTLDTPTLISPSQLKPNSSISSMCFLPSPTLSPMSASFELHSSFAFLNGSSMGISLAPETPTAPPPFKPPPGSDSQAVGQATELAAVKAGSELANGSSAHTSTGHLEQTNVNDTTGAAKLVAGESDLAHLVTSARDKVGAGAHEDDDHHEMDVDSHTIPRIYVSDELRYQEHQRPSSNQHAWPWPGDQQQQQQQQQAPIAQQYQQVPFCGFATPVDIDGSGQQLQQRAQRDVAAKRALSPNSFQARINQYKSDRVESYSAPPAGSPRVRPKIKSAAAPESCLDLHPAGQVHSYADLPAHPLSQHFRANQAPYVEVHPRWASSSTNLQPHCSQPSACRQDPGRSNSAEPAFVNYHGPSLCSQTSACMAQQPHISRSAQYLSRGTASSTTQFEASSFECHPHQVSVSAQDLNRYQADERHQLVYSQVQPRPSLGGFGSCQVRPAERLGPNSSGHGGAEPGQPHSCSDILLNQSAIPSQLVTSINPPSSLYEIQAQPQSLPPLAFVHGNLNQAQPSQLAVGELNGQFGCIGAPEEDQQRAYSADVRHSESASNAGSPGLTIGELQGQQSRSLSAGSQAGSIAAKKYHCDRCSKSFTRSDMLTRHKRLHSGDRPYKCEECKQEFSRSDHLSTHTRTHTGEKPYDCKLCSYTASRKDMITRHMKVHNRSSPGLNFQ